MKRCRRAVWSEWACFPLSAAICLIWVLLPSRVIIDHLSSRKPAFSIFLRKKHLCREIINHAYAGIILTNQKNTYRHWNLACRTWHVLWAVLLFPLIHLSLVRHDTSANQALDSAHHWILLNSCLRSTGSSGNSLEIIIAVLGMLRQ